MWPTWGILLCLVASVHAMVWCIQYPDGHEECSGSPNAPSPPPLTLPPWTPTPPPPVPVEMWILAGGGACGILLGVGICLWYYIRDATRVAAYVICSAWKWDWKQKVLEKPAGDPEAAEPQAKVDE